MRNLLRDAISGISSIQNTTEIKIVNRKYEIVDGISKEVNIEITCLALVMPLEMKELKSFQNNTAATDSLKFFIAKDNVKIAEFLSINNIGNSSIIHKDNEYKIYSKITWQDKWIKLYGIKQGNRIDDNNNNADNI